MNYNIGRRDGKAYRCPECGEVFSTLLRRDLHLFYERAELIGYKTEAYTY